MGEFGTLVEARLQSFRFLRLDTLTRAPLGKDVMRRLMYQSTRCLVGGVTLNNRIAVCRNDWGHKYGQTSFLLFGKRGRGWSKDHLGNYEVEWRGPRREEKTQSEIDVSLVSALDEALKDALTDLF